MASKVTALGCKKYHRDISALTCPAWRGHTSLSLMVHWPEIGWHVESVTWLFGEHSLSSTFTSHLQGISYVSIHGYSSEILLFIYLLFLAELGLHCPTRAFSNCCEWWLCSTGGVGMRIGASYCSAFSCCRAQVLGCTSFRSWGTWA